MARIAKALAILREQVNTQWPNRSKANDGWIGNAAHQARKSDHNPNAAGVVQALDITHDPAHGLDAGKLAQALIDSRDPRIKYVISNRRICASYATGGAAAWTWRPYHGANAHEEHVHISVADDPRKYDDASAWSAVAACAGHTPPQAAPLPTPQPPSPAGRPPEPIASWMSWILVDEGQVFRSDPHEGGGAVKMGITFEAFTAWRHRHGLSATLSDLEGMTADQAGLIYFERYFVPARCADLPAGVQYAHFDCALNSGVTGAAKDLQRALGVPVDGEIGPTTLAAVKRTTPAALIEKLCAVRLARLREHPHWAVNGRGWTNRIHRVEARALSLIKEAAR